MRGFHRGGPAQLSSPRRLAVGVALAAAALLLGAAVIPVDSTLASFTDSETAAASPSMKAGTLGSARITSCAPSGNRLQVTWTTVPGSIPADGVLIRFTDLQNGNVIDFDVASSPQTTQLRANAGAGFVANRDYRVTVFSQLSTAFNWMSTTGSSALFRKGQGNGNNTCA